MTNNQNYFDEFDRLAQERRIRGTHRKPTRFGRWFFGILVLAVIAVVAGILIGNWVSAENSDSKTVSVRHQETKQKPDTDKDTDKNTDENGKAEKSGRNSDADGEKSADGEVAHAGDMDKNSDGEKEADAAQSAQQQADRQKEEQDRQIKAARGTVNVRILNGTKVKGLAADKAKALTGLGYRNVRADNYRFASPAESTVYYRDPSKEAVAKEIAEKLNIRVVTLNAGAVSAGTDVVAVVRSR